MIKGIIFDLDGVIVFTDKLHYMAWKAMADEMGIYFDETINNRLRGVGRMESLSIILEGYEGRELSLEEKEALAGQKNVRYKELLETMRPQDVADEVRDTLRKLREKGIKLAIGSSSQNAKRILERVELGEYFDAVSDGTNIKKTKPDPEVFLKAAAFLNLLPEECMVVEDAATGIDAAKAGGMLAAAIGDAAAYEKADISLSSFGKLWDLMKA